MDGSFTIVVVGAIAVFVVIGLIAYLAGGNVYEQIGQGGMSLGDSTASEPAGPPPGSAQAARERELEIRQMLQARSDRLVRKGGQPLDIDAELARLEQAHAGTPASHDRGLEEDVRKLVVARNERRARAGQAPLDVEDEVARTLRELSP